MEKPFCPGLSGQQFQGMDTPQMLQTLSSDVHIPASDTACVENIHDAGDLECAEAQGRERNLLQQIQCSCQDSETLVPPVQTPHEAVVVNSKRFSYDFLLFPVRLPLIPGLTSVLMLS